MELPTYFTDFLADIRPTSEQESAAQEGHKNLRDKLSKDPTLSPIIISTFLQGSYRRSTAVQPAGDDQLDVDTVVVTSLKESEFTPEQAINAFVPFVKEHYPEQWELQGRSIGLHLDDVALDLVITSAPSEQQAGLLKSAGVRSDEKLAESGAWPLVKSIVEAQSYDSSVSGLFTTRDLLERAIKSDAQPQWKQEPLRIPDRDAQTWHDTDPLSQMEWTWKKNAQCNTHYVNVVKALKWWRTMREPIPKYPKGYPIEHLIGQCCPDNITSVAQGVTLVLENMASLYQADADSNLTPYLKDHGVEQDVLGRVEGADFAAFHALICAAATLAREALEETDTATSVGLWRDLFDDPFPEYGGGSGGSGNGSDDGGGSKSAGLGGFTERSGVSRPSDGRFG